MIFNGFVGEVNLPVYCVRSWMRYLFLYNFLLYVGQGSKTQKWKLIV